MNVMVNLVIWRFCFWRKSLSEWNTLDTIIGQFTQVATSFLLEEQPHLVHVKSLLVYNVLSHYRSLRGGQWCYNGRLIKQAYGFPSSLIPITPEDHGWARISAILGNECFWFPFLICGNGFFLVWQELSNNWGSYLFCISVEDGKAVLDHLLTRGTRQLSFVHLQKNN